MEYTSIFERYTSLVESFIENKLKENIPVRIQQRIYFSVLLVVSNTLLGRFFAGVYNGEVGNDHRKPARWGMTFFLKVPN